ncbi:hypothetical protein [Mesorhizobium wenxiniae]|uniref:hypothetical protein n=1 Tax=Mesorhizobium wenxiniae TaxID=2014805 RepID=UPI0013FDFD6E|nr:hypothetical protein [Mesorhizobium wenxiniae]
MGKARYDARFSYACNLWHKLTKPIVVSAPSVEFIITPAGLSADARAAVTTAGW